MVVAFVVKPTYHLGALLRANALDVSKKGGIGGVSGLLHELGKGVVAQQSVAHIVATQGYRQGIKQLFGLDGAGLVDGGHEFGG